MGGKQIAFVHPGSTRGMLVELDQNTQAKDEDGRMKNETLLDRTI